MKKCISILLSLWVYYFTYAQEPMLKDDIPTDTIPFELRADHRIYVKTFVNDSDRPFVFLLDTGASDIVFNSSIAEIMAKANFSEEITNIGATSTESVPTTDPHQILQIGHSRVTGLRFIAIPYSPTMWDGVLGLSFLKNFDVAINYDRKEIYLHPQGSIVLDKKRGIPFTYISGVPVISVTATINRKTYPLQVELDSGSDRIFDINTPFVNTHKLRGTLPVFAISTIAGTGSNNGRLENVCFDNVNVGNVNFPLLPGAFSTLTQGLQATNQFDGVIGNSLLQRFNQTWDFKNNILYLNINHRYYTPFYDFLIN